MKRKTKNGLLVAGLVLTAVAAVAGISYGIAANEKGLDETNKAILGVLGDSYTLKSDAGSVKSEKLDILEKMYVMNEANLAVDEYATMKAYREATEEAIITDEYSEADYKEDHAEEKLFVIRDVELEAEESFTIKHVTSGDIVDEDIELTFSRYWGSEATEDLVSVNFDSELEVAEKGTYTFYLIVEEEAVEIVVDYAA
ncbi:MAG: hypothetical protein E7177_07755 [Erysipelotrichaceae bacterium]|nr:hypothetical protein [Erysipelotrichaceae bacterium]